MVLENPTEILDLDCSITKMDTVQVSQYDSNSREILVRLYNEGMRVSIPSSATVRIKMLKNDGHYILNDCEVINNEVHIEIDEQMTTTAGKCMVELLVIDYPNSEVLFSTTFKLFVKESVYPNEEIESTDEFKSLLNALTEFDTLSKRMKFLEDNYDDLKQRVADLEVFATEQDVHDLFK